MRLIFIAIAERRTASTRQSTGSARTRRSPVGTRIASTTVIGSQARFGRKATSVTMATPNIRLDFKLRQSSSGHRTTRSRRSTAEQDFATVKRTTYDISSFMLSCFRFRTGETSLSNLIGVGLDFPEGCYQDSTENLFTLSGANVFLEDCLLACAVRMQSINRTCACTLLE